MTLLRRTLATALLCVPLTAGLLAAAPATYAAVDVATYSGTFTTTCTMPYGPEGPENGPYSCDHTTTSVGCAAVADTGTVGAYAKVCHADLSSGTTEGSASLVGPSLATWQCDNGAGIGWFRYQPSQAEAALFIFPVFLTVVGSDVVIDGSYTEEGTNRQIVVRAQFPAVCAAATSGPGYAGTVNWI